MTRPLREALRLAVGLVGVLALGGCDFTQTTGSSAQITEGGWSRFRGPNGSGVAVAVGLPTRFGPGDNESWSTPLPPGHSSPVLASGRIFLTAVDEGTLYTYALDQASGDVLWRQAAPRPRQEPLNRLNDPASPTPATDGSGVYVFFGDFGLIAYDADGGERWQVPLGPFDNAYGMAASPVVIDGQVIQVCDQKTGAFMIAVGAQDGEVRWRMDRPGSSTGHSTPVVFRPPSGEVQLLIPGSLRLSAFAAATGERRWWVSGLAFEMKAVAVLSADSTTVTSTAPAPQHSRTATTAPFPHMTRFLQATRMATGCSRSTRFPTISRAAGFGSSISTAMGRSIVRSGSGTDRRVPHEAE